MRQMAGLAEMTINMVVPGRLWIVMVGALVSLVPAAEAARQKTGKGSIGKPAEAKAGLVPFTDSRGCKLWSSESAARRIKEIASHGSVTWQGVCKNGFISGTGVLREEGQTAIGGKTKKFAHFLSGSAHKGVRTGKWKLESFEKSSDSPKFTAGIATVEFVNGLAVGAPKPIAVTSWSQYTINFSTRILAPALKEQSQSVSASDGRPVTIVSDVPSAKLEEPAVRAEVLRSSPAAPVAVQATALPAPPVTPPPAKQAEPALAATVAAAPAPAPLPAPDKASAPAPAPAPDKAPAPATSSVFVLASELASKLASALTPAPARTSAPAPAPPVPAPAAKTSPANVPATPVAAPPAASTPKEVPVELTTQIPAFVDGQSFIYGFDCHMDTLDGQNWQGQVLTVKDRKAIRIHGWGVDGEGNRLSEATYLRLESSGGHRFYAPTIPEDRPDVARYLGFAALLKSGYRALVSAENLPAGEYDVMILMNVGGWNMLCGNGRTLKLVGNH